MMAGFLVIVAALCRSVSPLLVFALESAPASRSTVMTARLSLNWAASCRGVLPNSSCALGSAPACRSAAIMTGSGYALHSRLPHILWLAGPPAA